MSSAHQLFIGRLPLGCRSKDLEDIFYRYGKMNRCDVKQGNSLLCVTCSYVLFKLCYCFSKGMKIGKSVRAPQLGIIPLQLMGLLSMKTNVMLRYIILFIHSPLLYVHLFIDT